MKKVVINGVSGFKKDDDAVGYMLTREDETDVMNTVESERVEKEEHLDDWNARHGFPYTKEMKDEGDEYDFIDDLISDFNEELCEGDYFKISELDYEIYEDGEEIPAQKEIVTETIEVDGDVVELCNKLCGFRSKEGLARKLGYKGDGADVAVVTAIFKDGFSADIHCRAWDDSFGIDPILWDKDGREEVVLDVGDKLDSVFSFETDKRIYRVIVNAKS